MSRRRRWCARVLGWVTIGLVPVIVTDAAPTGWGLVWLLGCSAVAILQPLSSRELSSRVEADSRSEVRWIRASDIDDYTRMGTSA